MGEGLSTGTKAIHNVVFARFIERDFGQAHGMPDPTPLTRAQPCVGSTRPRLRHVERRPETSTHLGKQGADHRKSASAPDAVLRRDVVDIGVPVTSIERTIVDLARSLPFEQAVVAGDAALRQDPSARNRLEGAVAAASWDHGTAAVRAVVAFIDGRSESVGESRSRVRRSCSRSSSPDTDTPIVSISSGRTLESSASSTDSANTTTAATSWRRCGAKTLSAHSDSNARAGNARKGA